MLNKIIIMGRLTRDPELRRTQSGTAVTSFSLAVDRDFKSQSGEKETDFIDVVAWRSTAEFVAKYFTKGRMAVVTAKATTAEVRKWLPTTSISATPSGTALPPAAASPLLRPMAHPPAAIPPLWAAAPNLPRSTRRTATCRSDHPQVTPNSIKEEFFHGYGTRK